MIFGYCTPPLSRKPPVLCAIRRYAQHVRPMAVVLSGTEILVLITFGSDMCVVTTSPISATLS